MSQGEFSQHEGEDLEATRPNPRVQAERERLRDDLKDIAEQTNDSQTEAIAPKPEEQTRADQLARYHDKFFAEGGISGYAANGKWFVENAAGQYISFDAPGDAMKARMASEERLAKRAQSEQGQASVSGGDSEVASPASPTPEAEAPKVEAPATKPPEAPAQLEPSPEQVKAREALEDKILGSVSREIKNTLFGGVMVKAQGETLSYRTPEEYEQARQGFIARKEKREAAAQEATPRDAPQAPAEIATQKPETQSTAPVAENQPTQQSAVEKQPEQQVDPERAEVRQAFQEAAERRSSLDNLMKALRSVTDNDLRSIEIRLRDAQDGSSNIVFQSHRRFTEAMNMSAVKVDEALQRARFEGTAEASAVFLEAVKEQTRAVDGAYDEMSRNLNNLLYSGAIPPNSRIRMELGMYLEKTAAAKQQLARLAQ